MEINSKTIENLKLRKLSSKLPFLWRIFGVHHTSLRGDQPRPEHFYFKSATSTVTNGELKSQFCDVIGPSFKKNGNRADVAELLFEAVLSYIMEQPV